MSGAAEARDVAALSLKLQTDLHLKPHKAARVAKLLGAEAPALLHAPSDALSATVERVGARIRPEDLFSPVRVAAASRSSTSAALDATAGRRDLSSSSASGFGATGGVSARGAAGGTTGALRATGGRLAAPGLDPLKGRTLLSELPPAPRRRRSKEDVWTELSRADADAAVKEAAARKQLDAVGRARYQAGLATQLEQQRAARAEAARKEADYAASMDAATAEFRRQQREAAAARAAAAAALSAEAREAQDALAAAREAAKAARLEEERHALERIKATERAAAAKAAARKVEEAERVARWLADNKAEMAAKRAAAVAQRDADVRMLAEAARVAEEKERRRLEEVAARDAAIKAKLESMKEIFVNAAAAEAEAQARADRERIAYEKKQDADAAARAARLEASRAAVKRNLEEQAGDRAARFAAARQERAESLRDVQARVAAARAEERLTAERRLAAAAAYKDAIERQILADAHARTLKDETPLERTLNAGVLAGTSKPLSVTSTLLKPAFAASTSPAAAGGAGTAAASGALAGLPITGKR